MSEIILPPGNALRRTFARIIESADRVFFAGLPGVGKSLLLQQICLLARAAGRSPTLLQWDRARPAFESPRYPIVDGASHPLVIQATGRWLRRALANWDGDMLIGEAPLIGGRLIELARPADDAAEALLADERTQFVVPRPSIEVRALIESRRERSIAAPRHQNEAEDAPPNVLRAAWKELNQVAIGLGLANADADYSPAVYAAVYRHLLRHRHHRILPIDEALSPPGSVYDFASPPATLVASPQEVEAVWAELETDPTIPPAWHEI